MALTPESKDSTPRTPIKKLRWSDVKVYVAIATFLLVAGLLLAIFQKSSNILAYLFLSFGFAILLAGVGTSTGIIKPEYEFPGLGKISGEASGTIAIALLLLLTLFGARSIEARPGVPLEDRENLHLVFACEEGQQVVALKVRLGAGADGAPELVDPSPRYLQEYKIPVDWYFDDDVSTYTSPEKFIDVTTSGSFGEAGSSIHLMFGFEDGQPKLTIREPVGGRLAFCEAGES